MTAASTLPVSGREGGGKRARPGCSPAGHRTHTATTTRKRTMCARRHNNVTSIESARRRADAAGHRTHTATDAPAPAGLVVEVDFRATRAYVAPGPGPCTCGGVFTLAGGRHRKLCPAVRTRPEDRFDFAQQCPWPVCDGRGAYGRDCGPCKGPESLIPPPHVRWPGEPSR